MKVRVNISELSEEGVEFELPDTSKMSGKRRRLIEAALIELAAEVSLERNVVRCREIDRGDNNFLFNIGYELRKIGHRIRTKYKHV